MLKAIPNLKKTTTEADIELQLQEAFVSTIAAIDPSLDNLLCAIEDTLASQADYILFNTSNIKWNYLNADDEADTGLF
jgi:hypothetical protein